MDFIMLTRKLLAVPMLLVATALSAFAAGIDDGASMFSAEAIEKASKTIDRTIRNDHLPVSIETIASLDGMSLQETAREHAQKHNEGGVFVLIVKNDHKIHVMASNKFKERVSLGDQVAIRDVFTSAFRTGKFDEGLIGGVEAIERIAKRTAAARGGAFGRPGLDPRGGAPKKESGFMSVFVLILIVIFGGLIIARILGALMGAGRGAGAGYGAPPPNMMGGPGGPPMRGGYGYGGGGGGGFFSSMLGGIGGAVAGNWLYDQFSGRHHSGLGGSEMGNQLDPTQTGAGGDDWGGGVGGDWGDGATGGDAGGDWGGGGGDAGGDWGGGGGGDWGGGGGDWGGGGGDGGGW